VIALGVLAALGQAVQAAEVDAAIGGGALLGAVIVLVAGALLTPADWKPRRMREAEQPLPWEADIGADEEPGSSEGAQ
jgi:hypothetical protein